MTLTPDQLEDAILSMDAGAIDSLGATLRERAQRIRVEVTEEEGRRAVALAPLTPDRTPTPIGRVRAGTCFLVQQGRHPEQIRGTMYLLALEAFGHHDVAVEAVECGIADAMALREEVPA